MTISTKMFNEQTIQSLARLSDQLGGLQEQVASGKKPIRPSTDPIATSKLSAAKDMQAGLDRYRGNMDRIQARLTDADVIMGQVQNIMTRLKELSIQAANGTLGNSDRMAIRKEVTQHKQALVGLANSKDAQGQALFGGYQTNADPFALGVDGSVRYLGDNGLHSLPVSESLNIATGVDGASAFMRMQTDQGSKSVFQIVEEFETSLETTAHQAVQVGVESPSGAQLTFDIGRQPAPQSLRIDGPYGTAEITVDMVSGAMGPMIEAVNARTEQTGVRAQIAKDGNTILLVGQAGEPFKVSAFQTPGVEGAEYHPSSQITVQQMGGIHPIGDPVTLVDKDSALAASIGGLGAAIDHLALVRAQIGAYAATAEMQSDLLARKEVTIENAISGIEDADLTEVVTKLQSLMVNRDAVRQVFAKVGQQSLFDLIR